MFTEDRQAWTRPGAFEVVRGVHRIPCPLPRDGLKAVNVYVVADGDGVAVIDPGSRHPRGVAALEAGLASLGATFADVTTIVCTHAHYDHYGFAAQLRQASGAPVALGRVEIEMLRVASEPEGYARSREHRRRWLTGHGAQSVVDAVDAVRAEDADAVRARGLWEPPDRVIDDGDTVQLAGRVLTAKLTPGHTRGHLMFVDKEAGLLFAGDHVLPHITPSLGFEPYTDGRALASFLMSLQETRELDVSRVLPGHGPVFDDLCVRVDELLDHHRNRLAACIAVLADLGPQSAHAVARRLTWTRHERPFGDLDPLNRLLAVSETVTHLELLADRGCVVRDDGEVVRYAPA